MVTAAQRIAALERQVADLATEVKDLREQAFVVRTLEQMYFASQPDLRFTAPSRVPRRLEIVRGAR